MPETTTVYLKDYHAPAFSVETVYLNFDLHDDHALVTCTLQLIRQGKGPLQLFGDELDLLSLHLNAVQLEPSGYLLKNNQLIIEQCPDQLTLDIVTRIHPQDNTQLSGLYRSNHLFCTQCEAEGFRRITYFLDRPDVLATYKTKITANQTQYPVLLSNGNLIESGSTPDGRHWALWEDPFKKPSYLFALVAGDLACVSDKFVTASGRSVDLRIYVEPGNEDKCAHAMESLKKSMSWDESVYGREYDLDVFMIVAVSDFNMGAMENKGLNVFNSKYVLARPDTATDKDYADIESVIAHEYFHNWTGNRVTCRDWFQLSLKEGLTVFRDQEFSRDMNSRDVNRITDVRILRESQFPEDAGPMAHPVRPESYQEINNFYTPTIYNKGAEVIRMQHTLLGKEGFRRGMDLYFESHDGQAVTIDDFVAAMEKANRINLTQFKLWYSQAGTPVVDVQSNYSDNRLTLNFTQSCRPTAELQDKKPFHIPIRVALFDSKGRMMSIEKEVLEFKKAEQQFVFNELSEKPVVSFLRDFSAPIYLNYDASHADLLFLLRHETDGYAKWNAGRQLVLNCFHEWFEQPLEQWKIPEALTSALNAILLDDSLDMALRALLLSTPGFEEVAATLAEVDVNVIEAARVGFQKKLGLALYDDLHQTYDTLWQAEDHSLQANAFGRRSLRNACLSLMMRANEAETLALCQNQFATGQTMTDQIASFALLANSTDSAARLKAIKKFYVQWANEELVLDKWFAIQATCELPNTLEQVKELMQHPAFSIKNPNKVRAVIGAFCLNNPRHFHAQGGNGYVFLREMLIIIDKINPQITARLATPFTQWQRYDGPRQALMKRELQALAQMELSRDLREVVDKSLAVQ